MPLSFIFSGIHHSLNSENLLFIAIWSVAAQALRCTRHGTEAILRREPHLRGTASTFVVKLVVVDEAICGRGMIWHLKLVLESITAPGIHHENFQRTILGVVLPCTNLA